MSAPEQVHELLPCPNPWCEAAEREGDFSPQLYRRNFGNWYVCCTSCPQNGPICSTEAQAIAAWNTRHTAQSDALAVMREAREALEAITSFTDMSSPYVDADPLIAASRAALTKLTAAIDQMGGG
jgi:hypothetical protein